MNSSHQSTLLLAASLACAVGTAFAQSSASTSSSQDYAPAPVKSGASLNANSTGRTSAPGTAREFTTDEFVAVDTDADGRISLQEFVSSPILSGKSTATPRSDAGGTPRSDETTKPGKATPGRNTAGLFHALDRNGNGYLNEAEMAVFYQTDPNL